MSKSSNETMTMPALPAPLVNHPNLGPLFDSTHMHLYAAKYAEELAKIIDRLTVEAARGAPAGMALVPVTASHAISSAIEEEIDDQLEASGIAPRDMVRQDSDRVWAVAIEASARKGRAG
ncbi:hypothetical protein IV454_16190 [Massilia antarctica]|uniref:Uncharacterized protein n=1 Tax=Massilia antarctica TaxID=2765360 RepID=A0AA48WID8_9BURK|nr:hypothetical protein [Massilia antarctica]QPI52887.1 hypothetical protein IV454_16190 [Massilia antarctica]